MIDWNGNGRLDPADIAISIALDMAAQEQAEVEEEDTDLDVRTEIPKTSRLSWLRKWFRKT